LKRVETVDDPGEAVRTVTLMMKRVLRVRLNSGLLLHGLQSLVLDTIDLISITPKDCSSGASHLWVARLGVADWISYVPVLALVLSNSPQAVMGISIVHTDTRFYDCALRSQRVHISCRLKRAQKAMCIPTLPLYCTRHKSRATLCLELWL
jgi:hypothetical protein